MNSKEISSKQTASADSYMGPVTRSRSKEINHEESQTPVIANKMLKRISEYSRDDISIAEDLEFGKYTLPHHQPRKISNLDVMSVMMTNTSTSEERLAELEKKLSMLLNVIKEKDDEITSLKYLMEGRDVAESGHTAIFRDKGKSIMQEDQSQHSASIATLSVQQLQDMIMTSIRAQYGGPAQSSLLYSKPYTKRIDNLRMPAGYQPPKFQQFDGKGNPKQHVAHFVETCENAGTRGDLLVKQFVRTLKGNAFDWYTDLESESVDSWEELEREFLNRFYSTRRIVSMIELTSTKQRKGEPVVDYINRWRALSLDCKDRLTELSAVDMCIQGMHWGLLYILQGIKPRTFEELATRAHDMELSIANRGNKDVLPADVKKEKKEVNNTEKIFKKISKESMVVNTNPVKFFSKERKMEKQQDNGERRRLTLKERQEKVYPFPDSDVADMLEQLLEKQLIQLPECKRPEELRKTNDPNYCKYHRVVSHPVEKCFVLKELILRLAQERKIELDLDEVAQANHATVTFQPKVQSFMRSSRDQLQSLIQFGSFEPVVIWYQGKPSSKSLQGESFHGNYNQEDKELAEDDNEVWTIVTRRKKRKSTYVAKESRLFREHKRRNRLPKTKGRKTPRRFKSVVEESEHLCQKSQTVTLAEFFPKSFLENDEQKLLDVIACHAVTIREDLSSSLETTTAELGDTSPFNLEKLLSLPETTENALSEALVDPDSSSTQISKALTYEPCCMSISFTDEDLLLGSKPHNRPLFVSRYIQEQKIGRVLIDDGSAVNIMPKSTLKQLGISMEELSSSKLMIHGFNQGGQKAIGMMRLELIIGDLKADTLFHIIDCKTTYKLLLGRPWIHGNGVVTSTLHQYFKYYQDGIKKVEADTNPFSDLNLILQMQSST